MDHPHSFITLLKHNKVDAEVCQAVLDKFTNINMAVCDQARARLDQVKLTSRQMTANQEFKDNRIKIYETRSKILQKQAEFNNHVKPELDAKINHDSSTVDKTAETFKKALESEIKLGRSKGQ